MKIAYLIAAHNDPCQLERLIRALHIPNATDFYIHIDRKSPINEFENVKKRIAGHEATNITLTSTRVYTNWGGIRNVSIKKY